MRHEHQGIRNACNGGIDSRNPVERVGIVPVGLFDPQAIDAFCLPARLPMVGAGTVQGGYDQ